MYGGSRGLRMIGLAGPVNFHVHCMFYFIFFPFQSSIALWRPKSISQVLFKWLCSLDLVHWNGLSQFLWTWMQAKCSKTRSFPLTLFVCASICLLVLCKEVVLYCRFGLQFMLLKFCRQTRASRRLKMFSLGLKDQKSRTGIYLFLKNNVKNRTLTCAPDAIIFKELSKW